VTPDQYIAKIRQVQRDIEANREADTLRITFDLIAQVKERIQSGGTDSFNRSFAPYTPDYAKYGRTKMGYQSRYVDFTRQGRLWASIVPVTDKKSKDAVGFTVKPRDSENQAKLDGQFAKRGNILLPTAGEIAIAEEANNLRIQKYLEQLR